MGARKAKYHAKKELKAQIEEVTREIEEAERDTI